MCSPAFLFFRNVTRIQPGAPSCVETLRIALIDKESFRLMVACWQPVCIYRLDSNLRLNAVSLSETATACRKVASCQTRRVLINLLFCVSALCCIDSFPHPYFLQCRSLACDDIFWHCSLPRTLCSAVKYSTAGQKWA